MRREPVRRFQALGLGLAMATSLAVGLCAAPAHADPAMERARARDAYDRATRAYDKGDYVTATREYAEADRIAPTNASLEAALEAAIKADDPEQGQELVERAATRTLDRSTTATVASARARFADRTARLVTDCAGATTCVLSVDGVAKDPTRALFVKHGPHTMVLQRGDERIERLVDVRGAQMTFPVKSAEPNSAPPPPDAVDARDRMNAQVPAPKPAAKDESGLAPGFFYAAAGLTTLAGGLTIASALDTASQHDRFKSTGCVSGGGPVPSSCSGIESSGKDAQLRTNVGIGVTAALAVSTAALGIFFVRWHGPEGSRVSLGVRPGSAFVELVTP